MPNRSVGDRGGMFHSIFLLEVRVMRQLIDWLRVMLFGWVICAATAGLARAQYNIQDFDPTAEGPWSDVLATTLEVPQVLDGSIVLDASPSAQEYGGFAGVNVTPGNGDNAWILDWPPDREWDGQDDSSFTFYLAHDTDFLYVGVQVLDDAVNSDDENAAFWKDDTIEIIVDAVNDRYDINTDLSNDPYGGHGYFNYEGRFSHWDDTTGEISGTAWSTAVDWTYGTETTDDVTGVGQETATGWDLEVRLSKRLFENPDAGNKLEEGYVMGFNIGMDDDDMQGPGLNGSAERSQDLEVQYWWANRARIPGWNEELAANYTDEEIANRDYEDDFNATIDGAGRLTHGGTGEIVFGGLVITPPDLGDVNGDGVVNGLDVDPFVDVLLNGPYQAAADMNEDGDVNGLDVDPFVAAVVGGAQQIPEPSTLLLALLALGALGGCRKWGG
jgi:hypothetical protein